MRLFFTKPTGRRSSQSSSRGKVNFHPRLECLEDRTVPSTVTNLADSGLGSLRYAIANTPASGTVDFQPRLTGSIILTGGALFISNDLTIAGPGAGVLTVSGNHVSAVLGIPKGNVSISGLTFADGTVDDTGNSVSPGAGIANYGDLSLANVVIEGNSYTGSSEGGGGIYSSGTLTLTSSTIIDNSANAPSAGGGGGVGGGIENKGNMTITDCTIIDNSATTGGGGLDNQNTLAVYSSTFSGNSGTLEGGGVLNDRNGYITLTNTTFSGNSAASGAGICEVGNSAAGSVANCTLSGNTASSTGGGLTDQNPYGSMAVGNTIIAGNSAPTSPDFSGTINSQGHNLIGDGTGASGFAPTDLVGTAANPINPQVGPLQDNGGPTQSMALLSSSQAIDAGDNSLNSQPYDQRGPGYPRVINGTVDIGAFESHILAVLNTNDSGAGSLRQAILDANSSSGKDTITFLPGVTGVINLASALPVLSTNIDMEGPGALSLTVQPSSGDNFGVFTVGTGAVVAIAGLTIADGTAAVGGGILNSGGTVSVNACAITGNSGGGVDNAAGTLTVSNCTIANNLGPDGGGIINAATMTLSNSTIAGNSATGAGSGGGIDNTGTLTVSSTTIANNNAAGGAGGGVFSGGLGTVTIYNTLIAQNQAPTGPDVAGLFVSQGYNLIGNGAGGSGFTAKDLVGTSANPIDPKLGSLQNNGGPTSTLALLTGSPAIDAGDNTTPPGVYDQRGPGFPRIANGTIDIGAYELQVSLPTVIVLNTNDSGAGSLRQAILDANALPGDKVITFAPGVTGTINLATVLPDLSTNIDLQGPGSANLSVEQNNYIGFTIFTVANGATVTLSAMTIASVNNANGTLTVNNCVLNGLSSYSWEDLTVSSCTLHDSSLSIAASPQGTGGVVTVRNCTISSSADGIALGAGTMTVSNCSIATESVGISSSGTLTVSDCSIQACTGGGVNNAGTATINNSTIAKDTALDGAGIYNTGTLSITNSTVADNDATGAWVWEPAFINGIYTEFGYQVETSPAVGGGIWNSGTLTLTNCTIASNTATTGVPGTASNGGGIASTGKGTVTVHNTIIAQNQSPTAADVAGAFASMGYNLIGDGTGSTGFTAAGDQVGTSNAPINPLLGPLQNNGGPTETMALLFGSPALDAGSNDVLGPPLSLTTDQRGPGYPRLVGTQVDIGAVEGVAASSVSDTSEGRFVQLVYVDLLNRSADPAGLANWTSQLQSLIAQGMPQSTAENSIVYQIETNPGHEYFNLVVQGYYVQYLGRLPGASDAVGVANDVSFLAANILPSLTFPEAEVRTLILTSPEYVSEHGGTDNKTFVNAVYQDNLGRTATGDAGAAIYVAQLNAGQLSRTDFALKMLLGVEFETDLVMGYYTEYLRRVAGEPDAAHISWLLGELQSGVPEVLIVSSIMGDQGEEYFNLAQTY
jgi:hypothetical protein